MTRKRSSGGKRATEAKHRTREAERNRTTAYQRKWRKRYAALNGAPKDPDRGHEWLASVMLLLIEEALSDFALPAEQRREQVGRLAAQAAKVLDPAKLNAEIDRLEHALEELQHARDLPPSSPGAPSPPAH